MTGASHGGKPSTLSPERQAEAKRLWQAGELSAAAIAAEIGTTKNAILGMVHRRGWGSRAEAWAEPQTIFDRMDALEATFNAVLRENPPGKGRVAQTVPAR